MVGAAKGTKRVLRKRREGESGYFSGGCGQTQSNARKRMKIDVPYFLISSKRSLDFLEGEMLGFLVSEFIEKTRLLYFIEEGF